jgi:hypothetical protein
MSRVHRLFDETYYDLTVDSKIVKNFKYTIKRLG